MTNRDLLIIKNLYYLHRYLPSNIARLYGVSNKHILEILHGGVNQSVSIISDLECLMCGLEEAQEFYIDGNKENQTPQNLIMLCESDRRRVQHLHLRKTKDRLIPQF